MKKLCLTVLVFLLGCVLCLGLASCDLSTVEKITNEIGAQLEGGNFQEGSVLNLKGIAPTEQKAIDILDTLAKSGIAIQDKSKAYVYDISVTKDNAEVQPDGTVKLTVPMPEDERAEGYNVYHIKANGAFELLPSDFVGGKLIFETDGFSSFVFVPTYNCITEQRVSTLFIGASPIYEGSILCNGVPLEQSWREGLATLQIPTDSTVELRIEGKRPELTFLGWYEAEDSYFAPLRTPPLKETPVSTEERIVYTLTEEEHVLHAVFRTPDQESAFDIFPEGAGTLWMDDAKLEGPFAEPAVLGKSYTLRAEANEGFRFYGWEIRGETYCEVIEADGEAFTFTVSPTYSSVRAVFDAQVIDLRVDLEDHIIIDPDSDVPVPDFKRASVYAVRMTGTDRLGNLGYTVDMGGLDTETPGTYTVTYSYVENPDIQQQITVTVLAESVEVTVENDGRGGSARQTGKLTVEKNADVLLEAETASEDFVFLGWFLEDGTLLSDSLTYSHRAEADVTILARFKHKDLAEITLHAIVDQNLKPRSEHHFRINGNPIGYAAEEFYIGQTVELELVNVPPHCNFYGWYEKAPEEEGYPEDPNGPTLKQTPVSTERRLLWEITNDKIVLYAVMEDKGRLFIVDVSDENAGSIRDGEGKEIARPLDENFRPGKTYTLTAEAKEGYEFVAWHISARNSYTVVNEETVVYTTHLYSERMTAEFRPVVTALDVTLKDFTYDPGILEEYPLVSIPTFNGYCLEGKESEHWQSSYVVVGRIAEITNTTWGNLYLVDGEGNRLHVYGLWGANGGGYSNLKNKPTVGDVIAIYGAPYLWEGEAEMKKGYLLDVMPVLPDFENVRVSAVSAQGSKLLLPGEFTVDATAVDTETPGEYEVIFIYTEDPTVRATVTVRVVATPVAFSAYVEGGTLLLNGEDIGPDYYEIFEEGYGKVQLTAKGEENTVFLGWFTAGDEAEILIGSEESYLFDFREDTYVYAAFDYIPTELYLDGLNAGFETERGITDIFLPTGMDYDLSRILVFAIVNGEREALTAEEYVIDAGGFDKDNIQMGDYTVTFTHKEYPTLTATHIIRVLDELTMVSFYADAEAGGKVTVDKPYDQYNKGEKITVSVELRSERDYAFLGWYLIGYELDGSRSETLISEAPTYTVTLQESMELLAKIEPRITYLTVDGLSEVERLPLAKFEAYEHLFAADRGGVYACGALGKRVELTPEEYTVELGGLDPQNPAVGKYTVTFTYKADESITFRSTVFVWEEDHSFYAASRFGGGGSFLFEGELCEEAGGMFIDGEAITVTAVPDLGYEFLGWYTVVSHDTHETFDWISDDMTYTFLIREDTELVAVFDAPIRELTLMGAQAGESGSYEIHLISGKAVDLEGITVLGHSLRETRFLTEDEYIIETGDLDIKAAAPGSYTVTYIYAPDGEPSDVQVSIEVSVAKREYLLLANSVRGGILYDGMLFESISVSLEEGTRLTLTATRTEGECVFAGWYTLNAFGERELYSSEETIHISMDDFMDLHAVYEYRILHLEAYANRAALLEEGLVDYQLNMHSFWDEARGTYLAYGDMMLRSDSIYVNDIESLFRAFRFYAVDVSGRRRPIDFAEFELDFGEYTGDPGWQIITLTRGQFTLEINIIIFD